MTYVIEKPMIPTSAFYKFTLPHTCENRWVDKPKDAAQFARRQDAEDMITIARLTGVVVSPMVKP